MAQSFSERHNGPRAGQIQEMLAKIGVPYGNTY
jgi:hypothetical protein